MLVYIRMFWVVWPCLGYARAYKKHDQKKCNAIFGISGSSLRRRSKWLRIRNKHLKNITTKGEQNERTPGTIESTEYD